MSGARGRGLLQAGEREIAILFTNRALAAAERQLGKSVLAVAEGFAGGESGITDVVYLLRAGMEAARRDARVGGKAIALPEAFEVLDAMGFVQVAAVVMETLAEVLAYDAREDDEDDCPNP